MPISSSSVLEVPGWRSVALEVDCLSCRKLLRDEPHRICCSGGWGLKYFFISVFAKKVVRPKFTQKIPPKELNVEDWTYVNLVFVERD